MDNSVTVHAFKDGRIRTVYQKSCTSDLRLGIWYHAVLICALRYLWLYFLVPFKKKISSREIWIIREHEISYCMTTEETMLIQISAGYLGLTMLEVRGSRMMTHIPFQLQKRKKKKSKWVALSTGTILLGNSTKRKQVFLKSESLTLWAAFMSVWVY